MLRISNRPAWVDPSVSVDFRVVRLDGRWLWQAYSAHTMIVHGEYADSEEAANAAAIVQAAEFALLGAQPPAMFYEDILTR